MSLTGLKGKTVLITGASRGIGRAVAVAFSRTGAKLALTGRDEKALEETLGQVQAGDGEAQSFLLDVTDSESIRALPERVKSQVGSVDILVNNAGIAESQPFLKTDRSLWDRIIAVNLTAVYEMTRACLPGMLERKAGRIINISSVAGKVGHPYVTAYCASKHGVLGLTRALALEVAKKGVTVNAVCPSYVNTPMTDQSLTNIQEKAGVTRDSAMEAILGANPQGRLIEPEEVADAVLYLASENAASINGQAINICGGATPV